MSTEVRVAVFSDVHGNMQALQSVLGAIERDGPFDRIVVAGDHCLKGPDPVPCLDLIRDHATDVLIGNTDHDLADTDTDELGSKKAAGIEWTREQLGDERVCQLGKLPFDVVIEAPDDSSIRVVHANIFDLDTHIVPDAPEADVTRLVGDIADCFLIFGHLHIPYQRQIGALHLFDIAACGLPQDGDRRAVWGEFGWSPDHGWSGRIRREEYNFGDTVLRILDSDLPDPETRIWNLLRATYE